MASPRRRVRISRSRVVRTYAELWQASRVLCDIAHEAESGSTWTSLSSILLTTFTLEAYLNHIGPKLFSTWDRLEVLSPRAKLDIILEKTGTSLPAGSGLLQTVDQLLRFRNTLAHGKTHTLEPDDELRSASSNVDRHLWKGPKTEWEKLCTPAFAKRARTHVEKLVHKLHDGAKIKGEYPFVHGVGMHSVSLE